MEWFGWNVAIWLILHLLRLRCKRGQRQTADTAAYFTREPPPTCNRPLPACQNAQGSGPRLCKFSARPPKGAPSKDTRFVPIVALIHFIARCQTAPLRGCARLCAARMSSAHMLSPLRSAVLRARALPALAPRHSLGVAFAAWGAVCEEQRACRLHPVQDRQSLQALGLPAARGALQALLANPGAESVHGASERAA